ncbi:hypothetical protein KCU88_g308, partial [Aureobasidium melanogenum]
MNIADGGQIICEHPQRMGRRGHRRHLFVCFDDLLIQLALFRQTRRWGKLPWYVQVADSRVTLVSIGMLHHIFSGYPVLVGAVDSVPVSVPEEVVLAAAELRAVVLSLIARGAVGVSMGAARLADVLWAGPSLAAAAAAAAGGGA